MKIIQKIAGAFIVLTILCLSAGCSYSIGAVTTDGSTSMEKVIGILGEAYENGTDTSVTFNPTGSGSGIKAVSEGRCDIGLSSRDLKDDEKKLGLTATILAYDGIALIVNPENPVCNLDKEDIRKIYTGEITNWNQVGGNNAKIVLIGREAGSGTRDGFETIINAKDVCRYRQELTSSGDVITTVSQNPSAIGYTSLASVKENVRIISVDGILPSEQTILDGSYVIQRPFVIITRNNKQLSETAQGFFDYITSPEAKEYISLAGVVSAN